MPLTLSILWSSAAFAGTAVWLQGAPDPAATPGLAPLTAEAAAPGAPWTEGDTRALAFVAEELAAARPLADVFDGELQIMLRLDTALSDVTALRPEDRDLVWRALVFQGFAVQRYFQDGLGTDPAAASYGLRIGDRVEVKAWIDAVALDPDRQPTAAEIPGQAELEAYQELRARHLLSPVGTVATSGLPAEGRLVVDGKEAAVDRARVPAGMHRVALTVNGQIQTRALLRLAAGETQTIILPASSADLEALGEQLRAGPSSYKLSPGVQRALEGLDRPLALAVSSRGRTLVYDVEGELATLRASTAAPSERSALALRAALGGGWLYDGDYLLQNGADGAPVEKATVNAFSPQLTAAFEWSPSRWLALDAGVDLLLPLGAWHDLPVGDGRLRLRPNPFLAVGLPEVQATAGFLFPWNLSVGGRVAIPVGSVLTVGGGWLAGLPVRFSRDNGDPDFVSSATQSAWLSVGARFGLGG